MNNKAASASRVATVVTFRSSPSARAVSTAVARMGGGKFTTSPSFSSAPLRSCLYRLHSSSSSAGASARGRGAIWQASVSLVAGSCSTAAVALCDGGEKNDDDGILTKLTKMVGGDENLDFNGQVDKVAKQLGSKIQAAVETGVPTQLSYGFVCGYASGYAMKKVGKVGAVVFGLGFCTLQSLSYAGYITVDHKKIEKNVMGLMDLNDDGKVDSEDGAKAMEKVQEVLSYNLPAGGGFATGFVAGVRSG